MPTKKQLKNVSKGQCPLCGSSEVNGVGMIEAVEGHAYRFARCSHCESRWEETYDLTDVYITHNPYNKQGD